MAGVSYYIKLLNAAVKSGRSLMCPFCGAYTISINNQGMCHICENTISADRAALMKTESELCTMLDDYNKQVSNSDFDAAIKTYDSILAKYPMPNYTYVKALTHIYYSNYELSKIKYELPGFMEENSVHREVASRMFSYAKLLLNKSIFDAEKAASGSQSTYGVEYTMFLSAIKLGDLRVARSHLDKLRQSGNKYIAAYAEIVYDSNIGDFTALLRNADMALKSKDFAINIFYYIAYALFRLGRRADAAKLSKALSGIMTSSTINALSTYASMLK